MHIHVRYTDPEHVRAMRFQDRFGVIMQLEWDFPPSEYFVSTTALGASEIRCKRSLTPLAGQWLWYLFFFCLSSKLTWILLSNFPETDWDWHHPYCETKTLQGDLLTQLKWSFDADFRTLIGCMRLWCLPMQDTLKCTAERACYAKTQNKVYCHILRDCFKVS